MSNPNGPLTAQQWETLKRLAEGLSREQLLWVGGYLAGFGDARQAAAPSASSQAPAAPSGITVLYGSQTGNAEKLARTLQGQLQEKGLTASLEAMGSYKTAQLKRERCVLVIVSTHGEGEPPDNARVCDWRT